MYIYIYIYIYDRKFFIMHPRHPGMHTAVDNQLLIMPPP